jgi:hypothetical protein
MGKRDTIATLSPANKILWVWEPPISSGCMKPDFAFGKTMTK